MFHQVKVLEEDQAAFRFLYRTPGSISAPLTYQMTVHEFGAISSPTSCIFALNKTADDHRSQFPDVADSVRRNFYVDNYLDSFDSEDEVIKRSRQMRSLLQLGGFNLTKLTSSSKMVIAELREFGLASPTLDLDLEKLPVERTLGVMWVSERDMLTFKIRKPPNNVTLTKRAFLSIISSVYDPLGLVAPVIFVMKSLLQDIWTNEERIGWDDVVPETLSQRFYCWYDHLEKSRISAEMLPFQTRTLDSTASPRLQECKLQRVRSSSLLPHCLTIPRLELQAAVEGLNIALTICRELEIDLRQVTFPSDSQTVLRWIHSKTCRFEVFVNNRIGKILLNTGCRQWRHVAGDSNPADLCGRGIDPKDTNELLYFHRGPPFLSLDPTEWYTWEEITEHEERDVNVIRVLADKTEDENHAIERCVARFSSVVKIQRALVWSTRFANNAKANRDEKPMVGELTVEEMPLLDGAGQMRIGGRILQAPIDYAATHPIFLPASQLLTKKIIWDYHVRNMHVKTERLLTDLRSRFWILSGRKVVKSIINNCWPCKRTSMKPSPPLMASLTVHRLTPHLPTFTYTGIDYFGPLSVRVGGRGRRREKRRISLFTCFTTRAVHLEVANGLRMEEFSLCFSRFVSLRGKPKVVYSDNGTNFVAAEYELRQALEELVPEHQELQTVMACHEIDWHFSPPHGPHFGGVWERIVQSCKRAMKTSIGNCLVTDRLLRTVIAEVEALLNARPLTHLSMDPEDPDPLTPNHFLYGGALPYLPLQLADVEDMNWPMSKVLEVIPSAMDNVVRAVKMKLSNHPKPCIRPVAKLCIMVAAKERQVYTKEEKMESLTA
ncbi:uncharacterized protein LOC130704359 [Daphnia carinata]|uniref:uncharacterized protein LOC130704359 n=1 Tax=Daphnia carinata TaxID=120202 RepID=UPI002868740C|nr:uncharacterized protein LOC130704359 [Daphnia carinata]